MSRSNWTAEFDRFRDELDTAVFVVGAILTIIAIGLIAVQPDRASQVLTDTNTFLWSNVGWVYLWAMFLAVMFCLWLLFGPWGRIKLGGEDDEPEFSFFQFFAMLFSAGLSTGLVFFGPSEALFHYDAGMPFVAAEAGSESIIPGAVQYTMLHWGLSPWSAYLLVGVTIAYYVHRRGAPIKPSTIFAPFIGVENLDKWWTKPLDIMIVVLSVGGVAVSLGFVVTQFTTGITYNTGFEFSNPMLLLLTVGLTIGFTISAALGVNRGILRVSTLNVWLFAILLGALFVFGPTAYLFQLGTESVGGYISNFVQMSLYMDTAGDGAWVGAWTIFYWAWWFSFAPMIGIFLTRICRGRTIRQVMFAGLAGTTAASFIWFIVLGGTSMWTEHSGAADILGPVGEHGEEVAAFPLFEAIIPTMEIGGTTLPFGELFAGLYLLLVLTFLITTVDSTTLSLAIFTSQGNENPSTVNRVSWGVMVGLLTSLLLIAGGLQALQDLVVLIGLPIAFVLFICLAGMIIELEKHHPVLLTDRGTKDDTSDENTPSPSVSLSDGGQPPSEE
ncbi:BCCT family transporter [Natronorubrum sp. FCH18a]|uniref:BCCT family transporter n=1 Tax=Natronorubrum sp. FCH18a TaxID=3447018 RepID=UPI003F510FC6